MPARVYCENCCWEYILASDEYESTNGLTGLKTIKSKPSITQIRRQYCTLTCLDSNPIKVNICNSPITHRLYLRVNTDDGKQPEQTPVR